MNVKGFKKHTVKTHRWVISFQDKCCLFKFYDRLLNSIRFISARVNTVIEYHVRRDFKDHLIQLFLAKAWSRMAQYPVLTNFKSVQCWGIHHFLWGRLLQWLIVLIVKNFLFFLIRNSPEVTQTNHPLSCLYDSL